MNLIYLLPIGSIEDEVLSVLEQRLHQVLGWEIRRSVPLQMPVTAFNAVRQQYEALQVMRAVADVVPSSAKRALGIIQEDLSIPMLTFVFGQAQLQGRVAPYVPCTFAAGVLWIAREQRIDDDEDGQRSIARTRSYVWFDSLSNTVMSYDSC